MTADLNCPTCGGAGADGGGYMPCRDCGRKVRTFDGPTHAMIAASLVIAVIDGRPYIVKERVGVSGVFTSVDDAQSRLLRHVWESKPS